MSRDKLSDLTQELETQYRNINGLVIVRKGYIAFEKYSNGFGPNDTHHVASVTKSVISALIGVAIDKGYIKSVDQKVLEFFPEYTVGANDFVKRSITIRHLLTMTAPYAWKTNNALRFEPLDRLRRQRDWVTYTLNILGQGGPIGRFQYCTAGPHLLSAILTKTTKLSAREFANQHLFGPLGIQEIADNPMQACGLEDVFLKVKGWIHDPSGYTVGGWGLTITPRDMARLGYLYLNGGVWDGKQVISKAWIDESTALNQNKYGYLWWLRDENGVSAFSALGSGGNVICCIPQKDMVVTVASKVTGKPYDPWTLIEDFILPAIKD
jgi:CubicO group peptidase (beta-lactamase class C family)